MKMLRSQNMSHSGGSAQLAYCLKTAALKTCSRMNFMPSRRMPSEMLSALAPYAAEFATRKMRAASVGSSWMISAHSSMELPGVLTRRHNLPRGLLEEGRISSCEFRTRTSLARMAALGSVSACGSRSSNVSIVFIPHYFGVCRKK